MREQSMKRPPEAEKKLSQTCVNVRRVQYVATFLRLFSETIRYSHGLFPLCPVLLPVSEPAFATPKPENLMACLLCSQRFLGEDSHIP